MHAVKLRPVARLLSSQAAYVEGLALLRQNLPPEAQKQLANGMHISRVESVDG